jgi:hypothetical protein
MHFTRYILATGKIEELKDYINEGKEIDHGRTDV